jgi:hypothetical protein
MYLPTGARKPPPRPKTTKGGPAPGWPTQGTPRDLVLHFIPPLTIPVRPPDPILHAPLMPHASSAPFAVLCGRWGVTRARCARVNPASSPVSRSGIVASPHPAGIGRPAATPQRPPPTAIVWCVHRDHHHVPKTPSRGPAPGGHHSRHIRACAHPLYSAIQVPLQDPIFARHIRLILDPPLPLFGSLFPLRACRSCHMPHHSRSGGGGCPPLFPGQLTHICACMCMFLHVSVCMHMYAHVCHYVHVCACMCMNVGMCMYA